MHSYELFYFVIQNIGKIYAYKGTDCVYLVQNIRTDIDTFRYQLLTIQIIHNTVLLT